MKSERIKKEALKGLSVIAAIGSAYIMFNSTYNLGDAGFIAGGFGLMGAGSLYDRVERI